MSRFIQGNCVHIMSGFPDNAVDFILTDPPYLVGFRDRQGRTIAGDKTDEWLQPACHEMYRVLKKDALLISFYGWNRVDRFIPGLLMLAGALLIWQVRDSLRPTLFAVWLLLVALLNARHGDVMTLSGVLLTLAVLFCVHGLVPAPGRRLQAGRWFAPAYALHLLCIGFLVSVL